MADTVGDGWSIGSGGVFSAEGVLADMSSSGTRGYLLGLSLPAVVASEIYNYTSAVTPSHSLSSAVTLAASYT